METVLLIPGPSTVGVSPSGWKIMLNRNSPRGSPGYFCLAKLYGGESGYLTQFCQLGSDLLDLFQLFQPGRGL